MTIARRTWIRNLLVAGAWLCFQPSLYALDPALSITQYGHSTWRVQDGAFRGAPNAVTQTKDGYLWIGTEGGLVRFDGVRFVQWTPPPGKRLLDPRVYSLLGARDGSLWIGTGFSLSHWQKGELTNYPQVARRIEAIAEDPSGVVWLVRTQVTDGSGPLCQITNNVPHCYGKADGIPLPIATQLRLSDSGELWIGGYSELCRWKLGSSSNVCFPNDVNRPETFASIKAVATARDGSVWSARDQAGSFLRLEHFQQEKWTSLSFPDIPVNNSDVTSLFVDRDNSLWVSTANHGVFRINGHSVDNFAHTDGLSSDAVGRFFQDSEGNVWAVTSAGLDNFRDVKVVSYSMREGLSAAGAGTVIAMKDGGVWIGNFHALDSFRAGKLSSIGARQGLPGRYITTFTEDHAGRLWVGIDDGLWVYESGAFRAIRHADGTPLGIVFSVAEDTAHSIWVRAGKNLDRISDFRLESETTSPEIAGSFILAANPQGGIYLGLVNGDLLQLQGGKIRTYPSNEPGNTRQIRDLLVEPDGSIWGTTLDEVARWKDGLRRNLTARNGLPCDEIFALVEDARGSLWIESKCGLIEIEKSQVEEWWKHPEAVVQCRLFDAADGMQPGLTPLKPQATRSADGRVWFVNGRILQVLDPDHLHANPVLPPVQVEEVVADHKSYSPHTGMRLPALTRDLEIDYTALSYVAPQKVLFRYMLEGHDATWHEPRTRRQAFYNNLGPGRYRFRVMASNNDGIWNEAGASLDFAILPAYYQTDGFRVLCTVGAFALVWAIFQLRVHQLRRRFAISMEARINERTRIARELHDTLLQTLHGLLFQFQAVRNLLPRRPEDAMQSLDDAITETEKALAEGRDAIQGIRAQPLSSDGLAEFLKATSKELASAPSNGVASPAFDLIEEGQRRTLSANIANEVRRISLELLRNAYRHSQATRIEAEIRYDEQLLRLRIRDNGKGIDPTVLRAGGIAGHWGLKGVRERAERVGAKVEFWAESGLGTEVEVTVPARIAYETVTEDTQLSARKKNRAKQS